MISNHNSKVCFKGIEYFGYQSANKNTVEKKLPESKAKLVVTAQERGWEFDECKHMASPGPVYDTVKLNVDEDSKVAINNKGHFGKPKKVTVQKVVDNGKLWIMSKEGDIVVYQAGSAFDNARAKVTVEAGKPNISFAEVNKADIDAESTGANMWISKLQKDGKVLLSKVAGLFVSNADKGSEVKIVASDSEQISEILDNLETKNCEVVVGEQQDCVVIKPQGNLLKGEYTEEGKSTIKYNFDKEAQSKMPV